MNVHRQAPSGREASGVHAGGRFAGNSLGESVAGSAPPRGPAGSARARPVASLPGVVRFAA